MLIVQNNSIYYFDDEKHVDLLVKGFWWKLKFAHRDGVYSV